MPKGKGLLSQGMAFSTSLFTDVAGVAMQGVRQVRLVGTRGAFEFNGVAITNVRDM